MINIYCLDVSVFEDEKKFDEYYSRCSDFRKKKISALIPKSEKRLSLGVSVLLDHGLKKYGLCEKNMRYVKKENGKPYFENAPEIHFSISHSGNCAAVAFSDREVGIDVEKIKELIREIAIRFFSEKENIYISMQRTAEKQKEAFYRIWTLKESLVKATGKGFSISPSDLCFDLSGNEIKLDNKVYADYHFGEIQQVNGYAFAYCSREIDPDVSFETVEL